MTLGIMKAFERFDRTEGEQFYFGERLAQTWLDADHNQRKNYVTAIKSALQNPNLIKQLWNQPGVCQNGLNAVPGWLQVLQVLSGDTSGSLKSAVAAFDEAWPPMLGHSAPGSLTSAFRPDADDGLSDRWRQLYQSILARAAPATEVVRTPTSGRGRPDYKSSRQAKISNVCNTVSIGSRAVSEILCGLNDPTRQCQPAPSAKLPVLFDDANPAHNLGHVAWLTVELFQFTPTLFYPDPLKLGWTALPDGKESFHQASQRVWHQVLAATTSTYWGRWSLAGYEPKSVFAQPSLTGRSLEAAMACAILAAHSHAVGQSLAVLPETEVTRGTRVRHSRSVGEKSLWRFVDELDDRRTVSATLDNESGKEVKWFAWPLGPVAETSVEAKLTAASRAGINLVLLSWQQPAIANEHRIDKLPDTSIWYGLGVPPPQTDDECRTKQRLVIRRVRTLGEAYEILCEHHRWLRSVHESAEQDFWTTFAKESKVIDQVLELLM